MCCLTKTVRCALAIVLTSFAAASSCGAVEAGRWSGLADTVFQHLARDNELPNSAIPAALAEDGDGFLWVGSQNGLARWDGYHFRTFKSDPRNSGALPDNFIKALYTDTQGRLWIGTTSGGLARYDRDQDRFITYPAGPNGLSHVSVRAIVDDGMGGVWVATDGGLDRLQTDSGAVSHLRHDDNDPSSLPDNRVRALLRDHNGTLWVGTPKGLLRRDAGATRFTAVPLPDSAGRLASVWAFFEDSAGRIWIGTLRHGAYVIDPKDGAARPVLESDRAQSTLQTEGVHAIAEIRPGEIWVGTLGQGIVAVDTATFHTRRIRHDPTLQPSLADDTVQALHKDRAGLIWICTNRSLSRHDPRQAAVATVFGASSRKDGISDGDIYSIMPTPDGHIWLGVGNKGVDILDPTGVRVGGVRADPKHPESALPADYVNALVVASTDGVYLGTEQGLYRADRSGTRVVRVAVPQRDSTAAVWTLLLHEDVLWIGGADGFWGVDVGAGKENSLVHAEDPDELTDQRVTVIDRGPAGSLWIGTKYGLNRFDRATRAIERILPDPRDPAALAAGYVSSLLTDTQGRLWVATQGGGVNVLEARDARGRARFRRLGIAEGLANDNVSKLLQDAQGHIWASTDDGLAVIDPKTFAIRTLRRAEGVPIWSYWVGAGATTPQGELLFGGVGGLTIVRPELLTDWSYHPPVVVTDIRIGGKPVPANRFNGEGSDTPLTITPGANSIAVEFSALDYSAPERNRFAYRLDGFDADWVETEPTRRLAAYTNLRPGDYRLRLRGSNRDGVWTERAPTLPIHVLPAWYQTIGLRIAGGFIAFAVVAALVQRRTAYLRRRHRELEQLVVERTAELRESQRQLEQIAYFDTLTTLPNRRMFTEDFRKLVALTRRQGERFALLLVDLDRFKQINDTRGHDAGDALLIETARRLKAAVRGSDCVARLGGDEFAVLLVQHPDTEAINGICHRIIDSFESAVPLNGTDVTTSVSVGVAVFPDHGGTEDELYKSADLALYEAKRMGRDTWRWYRPELEPLNADLERRNG